MNRSFLVRSVAFAVSLFAAVACSSSSSSSSSGQTVRSQCNEVAQTLCKRTIDTCGATGQGTSADCITQGTSGCCASSCDASALSSEASVQTCENDLNATPCATLWDGVALHLPASCKGVVKRPAAERLGDDRSTLGAALSSASE